MPFAIRIPGIRSFLHSGEKHSISIGIGDNGFQHLSTSRCCCGIDTVPGFENWHKHNVTEAVRRARSNNGRINYGLIASEWSPKSSISRVINSKTRLKSCFDSVKNHIKRQWTHNREFSPKLFYGVSSMRSGDSYKYLFKDDFRGVE